MGPLGSGMTTLGSTTMQGTQNGFDNEDTLELREHVNYLTQTDVGITPPATYTEMEDYENDSRTVVSKLKSAPEHIWKTSQVSQTYSKLPKDN